MSRQRSRYLVLLLVLFATSSQLLAQTGASGQGSTPEEVIRGGYVIHQSTEIGYRFHDDTGSGDMYNTLVNLHSGGRILDQMLTMRSEGHQGLLFDNLFISSFGWGGDPNNALRARVDKNKWFDFSGSFRRDQNFFNYDLLANPLNPPTSSPSVPVLNTPHSFATRRRMSDADLTLLPQSSVSFRLGYSRNNMTGPAYSSFHEGTDVSLAQNWNTTLNSYRIGVDWKAAPRTVISYDQFLDYYKGDTDAQLSPFVQALVPGAATPTTVELGLPIDTANRFPCSVPTGQTSLIQNGTLTNVSCNGYYDYTRTQRIRTSTPTERLSFRSNALDRLDLTASLSYSSADMNTPYDEFFNGLVSRSFTRQYTITGPARARRISDVANVGATLHLTKKLRLIESFYFWAYRIPESFNSAETDWNIATSGSCTAPNCTLLTPISGITPTTTFTNDALSFNQSLKRNQTDLAWDVTKKFGARIGFRYSDRIFDHFLDFSGDEDHFEIHEFTGLLGLWAKPTPTLRLNFDLEHANFDNLIVRIAPRKQWRSRFQVNYTPRPWAVVSGFANVLQDSNDDSMTRYEGHNRNFGFTTSLTPRDRYGIDLAYDYNDVQQNSLICFNDTPPAGVVLPILSNPTGCAALDSANPALANSYYINHTHYGSAAVVLKPVKRVTTKVGYSLTSVGGSTPQFNILQPLGSLAYNYHQPLANVTVDLNSRLAASAGWNYYQYGEKSFDGPTAPRYFHANNATVSLRYSF
ncbi:MAG TPA: hypothetical protein VJQ82_08270 [Terriglobales bacterium]|nr:hypothetical protein [Terriglobales bacterium]